MPDLPLDFVLLLVSLGLMFMVIKIIPTLAEEYFSPVFRWSSAETDWMFYVHPFILSFSLKWFWERYKDIFKGSDLVRAFEVALVYGIIAMLPVLMAYIQFNRYFPWHGTYLAWVWYPAGFYSRIHFFKIESVKIFGIPFCEETRRDYKGCCGSCPYETHPELFPISRDLLSIQKVLWIVNTRSTALLNFDCI